MDQNNNVHKPDLQKIEKHFASIMNELGMDLKDDSLKGTPARLAKMYTDDLFSGVYSEAPKISLFSNKMNYDQMLVERNIHVTSVCEHHFLPFVGVCHIAYFPKKNVLGLSKFHRIVQYYSRRPQIQERLTQEIGVELQRILKTKDVAVTIQAKHYCVIVRGVRDINSDTTTSYLGGIFQQASVKSEFFDLINSAKSTL